MPNALITFGSFVTTPSPKIRRVGVLIIKVLHRIYGLKSLFVAVISFCGAKLQNLNNRKLLGVECTGVI